MTFWPRMMWIRLSTGRWTARLLTGCLVALAMPTDVPGSGVMVNNEMVCCSRAVERERRGSSAVSASRERKTAQRNQPKVTKKIT